MYSKTSKCLIFVFMIAGLGVMATGTIFAQQDAAQSAESDLFPPNAKPGECYARVFILPKYKTYTETAVMREASERVEIIPARYEWVTERILVKEASERLEVIPAT